MGASVGNTLISFRVNGRMTDVIKAMETRGYMDRWGEYNNNKVYKMPGTTMWHNFKSTDTALADLRNVCYSMRVLIESAVAVKATEFVGI